MQVDLKQSVITPLNALRKRLCDIITPETTKDFLSPQLLALEPNGNGHNAISLAFYADLLRFISDAGYGTAELEPDATALMEPLVGGVLKQLARQRPGYDLTLYQIDTDTLGYQCKETKWAGATLCARIAGHSNDSSLLQSYADILRWLNIALSGKAEADLAECRSLLASAVQGFSQQAIPASGNVERQIVLNSVGMQLVLIAPGEFQMGMSLLDDKADPVEEKPHRVRITTPFFLGVYPVTQQHFEVVMGSNPSRFRGRFLPVEHLSWRDAVDFCRRLSELPGEIEAGRLYRLPTEAEWEYACRAGTTTRFSTGHDLSESQANFSKIRRDLAQPTTPVGSFPHNPWGLFDMHGNVWEWTSDWFDNSYYGQSPVENPCGPASGTHHVLRGGSASLEAEWCRSSSRGEAMLDSPSYDLKNAIGWYGDLGMRVACNIKTTAP